MCLRLIAETDARSVDDSHPSGYKCPLSGAVINEALWYSASLHHDRLLQLINGVKLPVVIDSLLQGLQMA